MHAQQRTLRSVTLTAVFGLALGSGVYGIPEVLDLTPTAVAQESDGDDGGAPVVPPGEADGSGDGDGSDEGGSEEQAATIDFTKTGSITVHKRTGDRGEPGDGTAIDPAPGDGPVEGVVFTAKLVQEYTNAQDVQEGQKLDVAAAQEKPVLDTKKVTTNENGEAVFDNLTLGRWLIEETEVPAGYIPGGPFLVSVPMTTPERTGWNYDVHVYPKNTEQTAEKIVVDADQHTGDQIEYTITTGIPTPYEQLKTYIVTDDYDETMLDVAEGDVTAALSEGPALSKGTDYTVAVADGKVTVTFTETGLQTLTDNASADVKTTIKATVKEIPDGAPAADSGGVRVPNTATVTANDGGGGGDTTMETNTVETYFGKLRVEKTDEDGAALAGAKFELYDCASKDKLDAPVAVDGASEWTTGADGSLTINALHVTDFADDAPAGPAKYCLVEVEAPEGYELLPEPVEVDFTREAIGAVEEGEGSADDAVTLVKDVANVKSTAPSLPLTGGMGIGIIAALGALIVGAGAWLAKRNNAKA